MFHLYYLSLFLSHTRHLLKYYSIIRRDIHYKVIYCISLNGVIFIEINKEIYNFQNVLYNNNIQYK